MGQLGSGWRYIRQKRRARLGEENRFSTLNLECEASNKTSGHELHIGSIFKNLILKHGELSRTHSVISVAVVLATTLTWRESTGRDEANESLDVFHILMIIVNLLLQVCTVVKHNVALLNGRLSYRALHFQLQPLQLAAQSNDPPPENMPLTFSLPRALNIKFPLQPHQKYYIT